MHRCFAISMLSALRCEVVPRHSRGSGIAFADADPPQPTYRKSPGEPVPGACRLPTLWKWNQELSPPTEPMIQAD